MKWIFVLFLAGCAVKCDVSNNYYVVQMLDEDIQPHKNTLKVYWNVPTMQCKSKKIPFENLFEKFGIIQNTNDSFRGEKVAILYDPGYFPALLRNESSGQLRFRNGGVPQEGDLILHLKLFESVLEQSIPDKNFSGIGIIDFESWRPILRQNFGEVLPYKEVSYKIEKQRHWWWPQAWIHAEAKKQFEDSARKFMRDTLITAKRLRPQARWGYYGFPYCFNMATHNMAENCAKNVDMENDQIDWLWNESTALYPSVYSPKELTTNQLSQMIAGRIKEAARVRKAETPIIPYFWFRYRNGGFLKDADLHIALDTFNKSQASGFLIWGSSNDVNTVEKCEKLYNYIENVMGPAVAKYTKGNKSCDKKQDVFDDDENVTFSTAGINDYSTMNSTLTDATTEHDFSIETQTIDAVTSVTEDDADNPIDKYDVNRVVYTDIDDEETPQNTHLQVLSILNHKALMDIFERAFEDYGDSEENDDYKIDSSTPSSDDKVTAVDDVTEANYDFDEDEMGKTRTRNTASKTNDDQLLHDLLSTLVEAMLTQQSGSDDDDTDEPLDQNEKERSKYDLIGLDSTESINQTTINDAITNSPGFETSTHRPIDMNDTENPLSKIWTSIPTSNEESTQRNGESILLTVIPHSSHFKDHANNNKNTSKNGKIESEESIEPSTTNIPYPTSVETKESNILSGFFQQNYLFDPKRNTEESKISSDSTSQNPVENQHLSSTEIVQTTEMMPSKDVIKSVSTEEPMIDNPTTVESSVTTRNPISTDGSTTANLDSTNKNKSFKTEDNRTEASATEKLASTLTTEQVSGSAHTTQPKYIFYMLFVFYTMFQCFYNLYGLCT